MDPINIIVLINVILLFGANTPAAKRGVVGAVTQVKDKPKSYLQWLPTTLAAISLVALILAVFEIGTLDYSKENFNLRLISCLFYILFSWLQIYSQRTLGEYYSQDIVIKKNHKLISKGLYKFIRHPQYLLQFFVDITAAAATLSLIVFCLTILSLPFLVLRGMLEDKIHSKHFGKEFSEYKSKTGFMIPFVG